MMSSGAGVVTCILIFLLVFNYFWWCWCDAGGRDGVVLEKLLPSVLDTCAFTVAKALSSGLCIGMFVGARILVGDVVTVLEITCFRDFTVAWNAAKTASSGLCFVLFGALSCCCVYYIVFLL